MPKKAGIVILILGAVLIVSALLLVLRNRQEAQEAGQEAQTLLSDVDALIAIRETQETQPSSTVVEAETEAETTEPTLAPELPVGSMNGYDYVGYVEIPSLSLRLPVMAEWSYERLYVAPCRQFGSSRTDDLVIAAHNYYTHFGRLKELEAGDTVLFTDMDGIVNTYAVDRLDTIDPYDVDAALNSGYALVLYTCTTGGGSRVTVFCTRAEAAEAEE